MTRPRETLEVSKETGSLHLSQKKSTNTRSELFSGGKEEKKSVPAQTGLRAKVRGGRKEGGEEEEEEEEEEEMKRGGRESRQDLWGLQGCMEQMQNNWSSAKLHPAQWALQLC
ncbi:unnamed protein product [Pleuronectes platessa]|uniref:Uncharacterized protein n=1 Tax=Pleuronectes platessa TaxID=8262 RepID=A0A9N7Y8V7_PLEPL|nr:unnamed protein product [Pleuronectes platessa]